MGCHESGLGPQSRYVGTVGYDWPKVWDIQKLKHLTVIVGQRSCGKTTLMKQIKSIHKDAVCIDQDQALKGLRVKPRTKYIICVYQSIDLPAQLYHEVDTWIVFRGGSCPRNKYHVMVQPEQYAAECGATMDRYSCSVIEQHIYDYTWYNVKLTK